ncbi:MAG: glutathione S-transferase family protein [Acidiphilium sp.]|nr:glutathione S-transferase family protein [Acidiphilium sp.]
MSDLTLYTNPMSRGRIARWMLEEVGEPYEVEILDYKGAMKAPEYLALNPMGKVPALRHGDAIVTETSAICAYLADAFPETKLAPPLRDPRRAAYFRWLFFAAGPFEAAVTNKAFGFEVPPERAASTGYGSFAAVMTALDIAVSRSEFILGDAFSAADVYVGSQIAFGLMFGSIEKRPAFESYVQRLTARPAAKRAAALDDALIAAAKDK